jgi:putative FmdB family regulatory protein
MPTYEYQCAACDHRFEEFQSITAKPLKKCPSCKKSKVNRLLGTGAGMIFKGSGFYITDYRSEGYQSAAKADAGGAGGTSDASGGKSESPAAAPAKDSSSATSTPSAASTPAAPAPSAAKPPSGKSRPAK